MRALIVEDEMLLAAQVDRYLRDNDFVVDIASDGAEGLHYIRTYDYDVAIVDLGLPKLDGMRLVAIMRREKIVVPVLILTARSDWQDKVKGLEAGADDYLAKPFHMEELLARVQALIRRSGGHASPIIDRGPFRLDTRAKALHVDERPVALTAFEYRVLEYLAMHPGRVISKAELTDHVYEQDHDSDSNVLEVLVSRLRRKLDPHGTVNPIRTVRGHGYQFAVDAR